MEGFYHVVKITYFPKLSGALQDIIASMLAVSQPAPDFELPDQQGKLHKLSSYRGRIVIVNFWSAECPHSERTDQVILDSLAGWGEEVVILPIASNRNESAQMVEEVAKTRHIPTVL